MSDKLENQELEMHLKWYARSLEWHDRSIQSMDESVQINEQFRTDNEIRHQEWKEHAERCLEKQDQIIALLTQVVRGQLG